MKNNGCSIIMLSTIIFQSTINYPIKRRWKTVDSSTGGNIIEN